MGSQMVIDDSKTLCEQQPTPPVAVEKITDSLGRACVCLMRPTGEYDGLVIPGSAYRLLIDFLRFDHNFCQYALPTFLPYGWVSLTFIQPRREANQEQQLAILPEYAMTTCGSRTTARHAKARSCVLARSRSVNTRMCT